MAKRRKWKPERLRKVREDMNLTLQELAEKIGVDRASIWNWEKGKEPTAPNLLGLSEATGKKPEHFYS